MTYELKRIPLWPLAKVAFLIFVIVFLIIGIIYGSFMGVFMAFVGGLASEFAGDLGMPLDGGLGLGGFAMFFFAIFASFFGAIFYTIVVVLIGVVYNAIASMLGGIELELEEKDVYMYPHGKRTIPMDKVQGTGPSGVNQQNFQSAPQPVENEPVEEPEVEESPQAEEPSEETDDDISRFAPGNSDSEEKKDI